MPNENKYPRFIPDLPLGEDVFKGQSQTHLAECISKTIKSNDANTTTDEPKMPRIIGLEGTWGSGKSNVVRKIADRLAADGYYTFTYDAWGHQEDLQRRSILETLTQQLITDKVLKGKATIKLRNGADHTEPWNKQLSLLLSNKTTVTRRTVPTLSGAAIWATLIVIIFAVCSLIGDQLISSANDLCCYWWIDAIPAFVAVLVVIGYLFKDGNLNNIKRLVDSNSEEKVDEEYTSSEEPSVAEFKNWLKAISDHLGKAKDNETKKLIIVFDNMDRLPSEKVMQLWSSIYTFFAGSEFENIWTIIPYDYKHLCEAISGTSNTNEDKDRIKRFISKTFPIVYNVPQPVITDYREVFNKFFEKAFGTTEKNDQEHICQVFMRFEPRPNPRTVISFLNELVAMRLQWSDPKYRLQNIALFILKKDEILYNSEKTMDTILVSAELFEGVLRFYPETEQVRTQLCQFSYGLDDENLASELPLRNLLENAVKDGTSIADYADRPNFIEVLKNVLSDRQVNPNTIDNVVRSMATLDSVESLSEDAKAQIAKKWDSLANIKANSNFSEQECDDTIKTLIPHISEKCLKRLLKSFCSAIQSCETTDGAQYYTTFLQLDQALEESGKTEINPDELLKPLTTSPDRFDEYVLQAQDDYRRYRLRVDNSELNEHLLKGVLENSNNSATVLEFIKDDKSYDFTSLCTQLETKIKAWEPTNKEIRIPAYVNRLLHTGDDIITTKFASNIIVETAQTLADQPLNQMKIKGNEDIFAMYIAEGKDINSFEPEMIAPVCGCVEKYVNYTNVIQALGRTNSLCWQVNKYFIQHQRGHKLDSKYVAQNFITIRDTLGVTNEEMCLQFNRWGKIEWKPEDISNYTSYIYQDLFETYKLYPGTFTNKVVELGVLAMAEETAGFLVNSGAAGFWRSFVMTYLGTDFLKITNEQLTAELTTMLENVSSTNTNKDPELLNHLLTYKPVNSKLKKYLSEKMNPYYTQHNITEVSFLVFGPLLPTLGSNMADDTARGLVSHFITPVFKIPSCAQIIADHHDFYFSILAQAKDVSQEILKDMLVYEKTLEFYSPSEATIKSLIIIEEEADELLKRLEE